MVKKTYGIRYDNAPYFILMIAYDKYAYLELLRSHPVLLLWHLLLLPGRIDAEAIHWSNWISTASSLAATTNTAASAIGHNVATAPATSSNVAATIHSNWSGSSIKSLLVFQYRRPVVLSPGLSARMMAYINYQEYAKMRWSQIVKIWYGLWSYDHK